MNIRPDVIYAAWWAHHEYWRLQAQSNPVMLIMTSAKWSIL